MRKQLLLFVMMLLPLVASADAIDIDGVYYNLNTDAKTAEVAKNPSKYSGWVIIPSSVKYEGTDYAVTGIGDNAFSRCSDLFCVVIGKNVKTIASNAFSRGKLTSVWALMETPPAIANSTFSANTKATLHVPASSLAAYRNADIWNTSFVDIVAMEGNPINDNPIAFADAKVKALCVANWDTSGDGELSEKEAFVVTDLNGVFSQNETITSFDELPYFVNVSSLGENEFKGCSNLTSISIPSWVTNIGKEAFNGCNSLTDVWAYMKTPLDIESTTFSNSSNATLHVPVNSIAAYASAYYWKEFLYILAISDKPLNNPIVFADANVKALCVAHWDTNGDGELSEIEASKVTDLQGVFSQNEAITSFDELSYFISLQRIGDNEFMGCKNLASISIPYRVASIGKMGSSSNEAFYGCIKLLKVELHCDAIVSNDFGEWGFGIPYIFGSQVEDYILGDEITGIGTSAFRNATYMKSIKISDNVTRIGLRAFEWCYGNLKSITLPNSLKEIDRYAFHGCSRLTSINIPANVESIGQEAFDGCGSLKRVYCFAYPIQYTDEYSFPFTRGAYQNATLHVPANLLNTYRNSEYWNDFGHIVALESAVDGLYYDFDGIAKTAEIISITQDYGGGAVTIPSTVNNGGAYDVTGIGKSAFLGCSNLTSVTIPNSITSIGGGAFSNCEGLTSAVLGEGMANIGISAFSSCISLTAIIIPSSVTSIGTSAFSYCPALASIKIEDGNAIYDSRNNCNAIIETATNTLLTGCKNTVIPEGITKIEDYAFANCSGLTSVTIPEGVTEIGVQAFVGCTGLTSLTIPGSVTILGDFAFYACRSLEAVYITNLAAWCSFDFYDLYGNYSNPLRFAQHLYLNGKEVTELVIPEGVPSIGDCTFQNLTNLTSVVIPSSVKEIGVNAFDGCSNITNVYCYAEQVPEPKELKEEYQYNSHAMWIYYYCENATLHVPAGSIEDYRNNDNWKYFGSIVALTENDPKPTGIENVSSQMSEVRGAFYDLNGRRLNGEPTQKGVYIQNGKKIIVK